MPALPVFAYLQECTGGTNNGHIVNLSVRKPYLVVDMVLNFGAAPCGQPGGGVYEAEGGGTQREMWIISCVISSPTLNSLTLSVAAGPLAPWQRIT